MICLCLDSRNLFYVCKDTIFLLKTNFYCCFWGVRIFLFNDLTWIELYQTVSKNVFGTIFVYIWYVLAKGYTNFFCNFAKNESIT